MNGLFFGLTAVFRGLAEAVGVPERIAVLTSKYWGQQRRTLTVQFLDTRDEALQKRILSHMNAWDQTCGITFRKTNGAGAVRIARQRDGYWSYLGTDILHIASSEPTMNLEAFSTSTPEAEYRRVVRHETGHTLGFPHEHMRQSLVSRLDREKTIKWFRDTYGWDEQTVIQQVLTPLNEASLMSTPADQDSIMCYQLPGTITTDGNPIRGGLDINETDYQFAGKIYPKSGQSLSFKGVDHVGGERMAASLSGRSPFVEEPNLSGLTDG